MKRFKAALKQGLAAGAKSFYFDSTQPGHYITSQGKVLVEGGPFEESFFEECFKSFFPREQDKIEQGKPTRGLLTVLNYGDLVLLAVPKPLPHLEIFVPPEAEDLFLEAWQKLTSKPSRTTVSMPSAPKPVSLPQTPQKIDFQSPAEDISAPASVSPGAEQSAKPAERLASEKPAEQLAFEINMTLPPAESTDTAAKTESPAIELKAPALLDFSLETQAWAQEKPKAEASPPPAHELHSAPFSHEEGEEEKKEAVVENRPWPTADAAPLHQPIVVASLSTPAIPSKPLNIHFGPNPPGDSAPVGEHPINEVLRHMIKSKASDMHLTLGEPICLRISGDITRLDGKVSEEDMRRYLEAIMPERSRNDFMQCNDVDFAYEIKDLARFRVNVFRDLNGVGAVIRQIASQILSMDDLGLPKIAQNLCNLSKGLVLVTGPTGSGKSTTLAGMIDYINHSRPQHILTIEDPVEFVHKQDKCLINQREVHRHTASFARALRAALREDPDIILIGEMRDLETVAIAMETAETGHLVFGTLHTNSAVATIDRIIDQFPHEQQNQVRIMLAESLKGVISQTLIKKRGGGMAAAHEVLVVNKAVSSLIREAKTHMIHNHMQTKKSDGNLLMTDSLVELVNKGVIDPKDAYIKAIDKDSLAAALQKKGVTTNFAA